MRSRSLTSTAIPSADGQSRSFPDTLGGIGLVLIWAAWIGATFAARM
jgi:hypothetical protein